MSTRAYYFFCGECGADTATYEMITVCPYCRAGRRELKLIGETSTESQRLDVQQKLGVAKAEWISHHPIKSPKRHKWFTRA